MTAGGDAGASYLGGGCGGFTTSAPTFSVRYTAGRESLLRFYFVASSGDTTMIVNTPSGAYECDDDSFDTLNPTVDFEAAEGGRYDIWVGTFSQGVSIDGTLFVTERDTSHP